MTTRWQQYFRDENRRYSSLIENAANHWCYNDPLYHRIKQLVPRGARILDVGCGLGLSAILLQESGYAVTGIDSDPGVIEGARENAAVFRSSAVFAQADARHLAPWHGRFDLVFSVGVLEHFDRAVTAELLREQAACAPLVLCVFPTAYTRLHGPLTDERIYTLSRFKGIFREAGLDVIGSFCYGNVFSPTHNWVRRLLPHGAYRFLQDRFGYAMDMACIGRRKGPAADNVPGKREG